MRTALRSLWVWTAIIVLIVVWLPLLALVRLFDRDPARYRTGRWFRRLGMAMTKVNPAWQIEILGTTVENPRNPYVVVSNHQSNADIPIISCLPWEMKWVAKIELFKLPFAGWMMRLAEDIPVDRGDKMSRARVLVRARRVLRDKCSVMFFPEGTRSRDGRVLRFTDGAFRLAIKAQVPILPLAIDGTQNALPKHDWRLGDVSRIRLKVFPPIPTEGLTAADADRLRDEVRDQIIAQIATWRGVSPADVDATARSATTT
ncbi:MAG: 1-acylglycerol-3-phosphate O-acyltransferase [Bacteroidetes bacterium]|jgi:1-acyl-sn-glycerol-3-phosphate acyltransferase|nr:1-acylglycerol-3-phosphate O-acyltransferase [Bacteroidota bacterium]